MNEMIASENAVEADQGSSGMVRSEAGRTEAVAFGRAPFEKADSANAESDRNGIFAALVKDDTDIAGLVAYSIYKQNKLDWLSAFEREKRRAPNDAELSSYIIGESTPRRLQTYRHLAEGTLAGAGPGNGQTTSPLSRRQSEKAALTAPLIATYAIIAVLFVIGFWLAAHFTMVSH